MKNNGLFSTLYIEDVRKDIKLNENAKSRMATLAQTWKDHDGSSAASLWESFMKQAMGYLEFITHSKSASDNLYELFEDYSFSRCTGILYLIDSGADIDDTDVGRFWPGKLIVELKKRNRNWGILSNGSIWRLYSTKSSRPFEDYVELSLADTLESGDEPEYGLFEQFFHADSFVPEDEATDDEKAEQEEAAGVYKCRLDRNREASESVLEEKVKNPLLNQIDEVLQYICNGFIFDTPRKGDEYTEKERNDIFESAVKLLYRCLFLFYADSRRLLPSEPEKIEIYKSHSIHAICIESHKFQWGSRKDNEEYDLWQHFKGLINAINEGDPEYGIMGYNGGLFDDEKEEFLGNHKLRNDFMARALYLLSYVEPYDHDSDKEYKIPYEDLEVRHLGELYENILEYKVILADADRIRRRSKKRTDILLASETSQQKGDVLIRKGDVFFGETALERKQTGSYYTPESLVRFLNTKAAIEPLKEHFETEFRKRFDEFIKQALEGQDSSARKGGARSAIALIERFANEVILNFKVCDPAMGSGHFLVDLTNQMAGLVVELLNDIPDIPGVNTQITSRANTWRRLITRNCIFGVDINPLAVDLAKLSLWLNCFASNHKLTFLDQHLRCGNSLIGIRTFDQLKLIPDRKNDSKKKKDANLELFPDFDGLSKSLTEAADIYKSIMEMDEDDTDRQREFFEEACALAEEKFEPLADLYTAYLIDSSINKDEYQSLFRHFVQGKDETQITSQNLNKAWNKVKTYRSNHHFFHWVLNFPSIFGPNGSGGFNSAVGNPPWDIVKQNSQEFFSYYDPKFRTYKKQDAKYISKKLMTENPIISEKWKKFGIEITEQSNYFKEPFNYSALGKGDINTFKLFLERFFTLLCKEGILGIVIPSGIYTDQGCKPLRELFFKNNRIKILYCFENRWPSVFSAVDGRFKFVLFSVQKGVLPKEFKCAFMEHDPDKLKLIDNHALKMKAEYIPKFSPESLSISVLPASMREINFQTCYHRL